MTPVPDYNTRSFSASGWFNGLLTPIGQNTANPPCEISPLACSGVDFFSVISYTPGAGNEGTLISVDFTCIASLPVGIRITLVVGRYAVRTQVCETEPGHWQLMGHVPSFLQQKTASAKVPLAMQALNKENHVLYSATFGDFIYLDAASRNSVSEPHWSTAMGLGSNGSLGLSLRRRRGSTCVRHQSPLSSDSESSQDSPSLTTTPTKSSSHACIPKLGRTTRSRGSNLKGGVQNVILDITTPLDSFCDDWTASERRVGRRLVRFRRIQDGNRLIVSAERISPFQYDPEDIVISCIHREETDTYCVTSVDVIRLLQRLVMADFDADEKNRVRRNLDGLRPITVSKSAPEFESFFKRIMRFPNPKPRTIEKDVKVFDWKLLTSALEKIMSKYSCQSPPATLTKEEFSQPISISTTPVKEEEECLSPFLSQTRSREPSSPSSSLDSPLIYEESSSSLSGCSYPNPDTFKVSHVSHAVQHSLFSSDAVPHTQYSPLEQIQAYGDSQTMHRCYWDPDLVYGIPPLSLEPQNPLYPVALPSDASL